MGDRAARAEERIRALEPLGWKLGLERVHRLCSLLGMPQHRFSSVHVVGTNGKSSVARMTAALSEATGVPSGAYVSPHLTSWRERILIGGEPIPPEAFADAVERSLEASAAADRAAGEEGPVTQFELVTAAAFVAFAAAGVRFAAIEAGLGGRLDATNVIPSTATALTSVGLDHTEWLGDTIAEIAAEKLAVLRPGTKLVTGNVPPDAASLARDIADERGAELIEPTDAPDALADLVPPGYPRRNLAVAITLHRAAGGAEPDTGRVARRAAALAGPGKLERVAGDPAAILDVAHNPEGAAALAEALAAGPDGARVVAVAAILDDKDAAGIAAALAPRLAAAVATEIPPESLAGSGRPGATSMPAGPLAEAFETAGVRCDASADWRKAVDLATARAAEAGLPLLVVGSHHLVALARDRLLG